MARHTGNRELSHRSIAYWARIVALCWLLGGFGPLIAQAEGQDAACGAGQTTAAMRECENTRLTRADAAMNAAFRTLSGKLDRIGQAKLRLAQQTWIAFRDAEATFQSDAERGGTLAPLVATSVRADLTEARRAELEKAARQRK